MRPGIAGGQGNPATLGGALHTARNQHFSQYSQEIRVTNDITDQLNLTAGLFLWKDSIFTTAFWWCCTNLWSRY